MPKARNQSIRPRPSAKTAATTTGRFQCWQVPGVCLFLAAITFAVFGQTLHHEFIDFDDNEYVYANPMVSRGLTLPGIVWAFTHCHASNWHPLTWLSHMLDCQCYGLNPGGHHLTNVLLHTATVIALFLVLRQLTGALWRSACVAAVFAIHPLRMESVAWVAERKDVLSGLFFMLTIGAYVRYVRRPWSPVRYGMVALLTALGLMCKPMLVTLPVVLLLLDRWPLQRAEPLGRLVLEKLPLLALSAASCVATFLAQGRAIQSTTAISMPLRLENALVTCLTYLAQMFWPAGLAVFYPLSHLGLPVWETALAGALLLLFSALAWANRRTQPWLLFGWLWYLVMLLPVLGIVQVGLQSHADRYTYLPQIGVYIALIWLASGWGAKWRMDRAAGGCVMAVVLGALMLCAWKQAAYWQNSETLWTRTLACTPDNEVARFNFGIALRDQGRTDEAITQFQRALQINPNCLQARYNLGVALYARGNVDEAIRQYQAAVQIRPDFADAHSNLGSALCQKGRIDDAIAEYKSAVQAEPGNATYHFNLAIALQQQGRVAEAVTQYQLDLQLDPTDAEARNNLARLLAESRPAAPAPR